MKKPLIIAISCLLMTAGFTFAQTASFAFTNGGTSAGTFNPTATFTLTLAGTITGGDLADGYSLWIEAPTGLASQLSITGATPLQFLDATQGIYPKLFNDAIGAHPGFLSDHQGTLSGDLGYTSSDPAQQYTGTANLANYTFSLNNAAPGTYTIFSTTVSPKGSGISDSNFNYFNAAAAAYTITVTGVPEPTTLSLLALGGLSTIGVALRRRRRA